MIKEQMMFKIVQAQIEEYITRLTKADFDKSVDKITAEIEKIEKDYEPYQRLAINVKFDNKSYKLDKFLQLLKQQKEDIIEKRNIKDVYDTSLFHNIGGKNVDVSTKESQEDLKRDQAALAKQIENLEEDLAQIDNFVVTLLSGEQATLNISHTNAKFVKIADKPSEEEVLKPVEEYFDKLYDDTPGSPNMGKLYTHPEKHRGELSTEASTQILKPKFKKK
jgi:hypothetical protein